MYVPTKCSCVYKGADRVYECAECKRQRAEDARFRKLIEDPEVPMCRCNELADEVKRIAQAIEGLEKYLKHQRGTP